MNDEERRLEKEEDEKERHEIGSQYPCNKSCRICPFPGVKCREDDETARRIISQKSQLTNFEQYIY